MKKILLMIVPFLVGVLLFSTCEQPTEEELTEDCAGVIGGDSYYDYCSNCDNNLSNDCQIELSNNDLLLLSALNNFESKIENTKEILYSTFNENSKIRELGNVVVDNRSEQSSSKYKLFFSEYIGNYTQSNVYINYIYSADGEIWEKNKGYIIDRPLEDPYVIIHENIYYLFAEDKFDVPFRNIRRYHSTDGLEWIDDGDVLDITEENHYENRDVSSPTVMIQDDLWLMYYEGRGYEWYGSINLATSLDGLIWNKMHETNPAYYPRKLEIEWDYKTAVPDDLLFYNENYYLIYHGIGHMDYYSIGILSSTDMKKWYRINNLPLAVINDLMWYKTDSTSHFIFIIDNKSINCIEVTI